MLMPKDLWPEVYQNDDKLLARWLNKYYYNRAPGLTGRRDEQRFVVEDYIYSYVFLEFGRNYDYHNHYDREHNNDDNHVIEESRSNDIYVISNVTDKANTDRVIEKLYAIDRDCDYEGTYCYDSDVKPYHYLGSDIREAKWRNKASDQIAFPIRDFLWSYRSTKRYEEVWSEEIKNIKFFVRFERYSLPHYSDLRKEYPRRADESQKQYRYRIGSLAGRRRQGRIDMHPSWRESVLGERRRRRSSDSYYSDSNNDNSYDSVDDDVEYSNAVFCEHFFED